MNTWLLASRVTILRRESFGFRLKATFYSIDRQQALTHLFQSELLKIFHPMGDLGVEESTETRKLGESASTRGRDSWEASAPEETTQNVIELVLVALRDGVEEGRRFSNKENDPMTSKELNEEPYEVKISCTVT
ncbi:hypothetical protein Scep_006638 [Stephania cephalantha]|uniref:Uncharacterized protein n=1 Tax=Stephania cephalantha TaxID=152367 RepID=A0AAP0PP86_9MAGN